MDGPLYQEMPNIISILAKVIEQSADLSDELNNKENLIRLVKMNMASEMGELY